MLSRLLGTMKSNGMHISRPACFLGESPTTQQPHIWYSWLGFIYSARIERGMYGHLQLRQNQSWLSCASYPLWPPTTFKESFDQLVYLQDKHNRRRRYLAQQWWRFTCSSASTRPRHLENTFDRDADARDIRELCSCINLDLEQDLSLTEQPAGWECYNGCQVVLDAGDSC